MGRAVSRKKEDEEDSGIEISSTESIDWGDMMKAQEKKSKQFKIHNSKKKIIKFTIIDSFALFSGLKL